MKTSFCSLFVWIGIGVSILGFVLGANTAAVYEVLKLKSAGVGEDTLIAFVRSRIVAYDLTSDDLIALRDKGLLEGHR